MSNPSSTAAPTAPSSTPAAAATAPAAPGRRFRGGSRGRRPAAQQPGAGTNRPKEPRFEGRCDELTGHTYDVIGSGASADRYSRTTEEVIGHIAKTYKSGADISGSLKALSRLDIAKPPGPATEPKEEAETNKEIWRMEVRAFVARKTTLTENLQKAYALIWGQCSDALRAKLESDDAHSQVATDMDSIELLKSIRAAMYMSHAQRYEPLTTLNGLERFIHLQQGKHQTLAGYLESFTNCTDVLVYMTIDIGGSQNAIENRLSTLQGNVALSSATSQQLAEAESYAKEAFLAVKFISGADPARYSTVMQELENDFTKKDDNFPKTVVDAYNLLLHWKHPPTSRADTPSLGVAFTNDGDESGSGRSGRGGAGRGGGRGDAGRGSGGRGRGGRGQDASGATGRVPDPNGYGGGICFRCGLPGHFAVDCPQVEETAEQSLMAGAEELEEIDNYMFHQLGINFHQQSGGKNNSHIPDSWILLDNQSTLDIFSNPRLLCDIKATNRWMTVRCNAGVSRTNQIGRLPGYPGEVWFNPDGIANILSLSNMKKHFPVSYDSKNDSGFIVHKPEGDKCFRESERGLFYNDTGVSREGSGTALVNDGKPVVPTRKTGVPKAAPVTAPGANVTWAASIEKPVKKRSLGPEASSRWKGIIVDEYDGGVPVAETGVRTLRDESSSDEDSDGEMPALLPPRRRSRPAIDDDHDSDSDSDDEWDGPDVERNGVENIIGMTSEELVKMNGQRLKRGPPPSTPAAGTLPKPTSTPAPTPRFRAPHEVALLNSVAENKIPYTKREQARALLARKIQNMIGHPSIKDFKQIVASGNMLPNCPISLRDIIAAESIFGPSIACLKGKTVRRSSPTVAHFEAEPVPPDILERHRDVTLCLDIISPF
jgi:hypothetical protein